MIVLTLDRQSFLVCKWWIVTREWRARKTHDCHKGDQNQNMIYIGGTDSARMTNIWNDKLQKVNSVVMHDRCKMRFEISHIGSKRKCDPVGVAGGHQLRHHRRRIHTSLGLTNLDHREAGPYDRDTRYQSSTRGTDHLLRSKPTVRWSMVINKR